MVSCVFLVRRALSVSLTVYTAAYVCFFSWQPTCVYCHIRRLKWDVNCELCSSSSFPSVADVLLNAAQTIDSAAGEAFPAVVVVSRELKDIAREIDNVANKKISDVQNRLSFSAFRDAVKEVFEVFPDLKLRQRVMAVYHVGANFFLREDRSQGQGIHGTIQRWPDQFLEETPELMDAAEAEGGLVSVVLPMQ